MKKIKLLFVFIIGMMVLQSYGQDTIKNYIYFNGIKIDGHIDDFKIKLKEKGYIFQSTDKNISSFKGEFLNQQVEILVVNSPTTKIVWKVAIYFPEYDYTSSWYTIKNDYNTLKEQLKNKYGNYSNDYNFFSTPYKEGDGYEIQAIKMNKCTYYTLWEQKDNAVSIEISKLLSIKLIYENIINSKISKIEKEKIVSGQL